MATERISIIVLTVATVLATLVWPIALNVSLIESLKQITESNFFTVIIGTLVAAFAGAYGAQFIVEKNKVQESLIKEIRATNVAITISTYICRNCLMLKKSQIKPLYDQFLHDLNKFIEVMNLKEDVEVPVYFQLPIPVLQESSMPTDFLRNKVFEEISAGSRAIALAEGIHRSISSLNDSMLRRNQLIQDLMHRNLSKEEQFQFYFGSYDRGKMNSLYPDMIKAIYVQLDDCILASHLLIVDLINHGKKLKIKCANKSLEINEPDFSSAQEAGLFPDEESYKDWINFKL